MAYGTLNAGAITPGSGNTLTVSESVTFTGTASFSEGNITNVGNIALDTISSDAGTSIGVTLGTDAGDDFNVGSGKLVVEGDTGVVSVNSSQTLLTNAKLQVNVNGGNGAEAFIAVATNGSNIANQNCGYYLSTANQKIWTTVDGNANPRNEIIIQSGGSGGVQLSSGGTSWGSYSDIRYKEIIEPIEDAIDKVSDWRSVIGRYKDDVEDTRRSFLIAQDVEKTFPEAVVTQDKDQETEIKLLTYTDLIPVLVKAIQELSAKVTALENA